MVPTLPDWMTRFKGYQFGSCILDDSDYFAATLTIGTDVHLLIPLSLTDTVTLYTPHFIIYFFSLRHFVSDIVKRINIFTNLHTNFVTRELIVNSFHFPSLRVGKLNYSNWSINTTNNQFLYNDNNYELIIAK